MPGTRKLGRPTDHRRAMLRAMTTYLLENERIETTVTRAKEVSAMADKMISLGKAGDLHSKRQALAYITKREVVSKLFDEIAPRYENRNGGYTPRDQNRPAPRRCSRNGHFGAGEVITRRERQKEKGLGYQPRILDLFACAGGVRGRVRTAARRGRRGGHRFANRSVAVAQKGFLRRLLGEPEKVGRLLTVSVRHLFEGLRDGMK